MDWACVRISEDFLAEICLCHPRNYLFLLSNEIFSGSKYPENKLFNFEKNVTAKDLLFLVLYFHESMFS